MATKAKQNGTKVSRVRSSAIWSATFLSLSSWTVATTRAAIDSHEQGDFSTSALLAEAVLRDSEIMSALQTRGFALASRSGLPFAVVPSEGVDGRRAKSVAQDIEDLWWSCFPETQTAAMVRDAILLGVAVGRDDGQWVEGEWVPQVRRLRPSGLRWSEYERGFRYIDGDGRDHRVTPGVGGWVLHAPHGGDSWMFGAIRAIGLAWIGRMQTTRDWQRYCEKHGMPALAIEEPFSASDDVEGDGGAEGTEAEEFYADLQNLPQEGLIRLPQGGDKDVPGWKAYWLELKSRCFEAFKELRSDLRRDIVAILLGRDDAAASKIGGDGTSLLERVRGEYLSADAEGWATTIREQVLKPWVMASYDANRPELAPWPQWDTRPPTDLAKRAETLKTLGEALPMLSGAGVDTDAILEEFHLARSDRPTAAPAPALTPPPEPAEPEPAAVAYLNTSRRFAAYAMP